MYELSKLKREKVEILLDLSDEEIERYILSLSQSYYKAILEKDSQAIASVIESLKLIVETYEYKAPDIDEFINYCFVKSSNAIFKKVFDLHCTLWIPNEKSFASNTNTLLFSLDASRMKVINDAQNIKEMYELVKDDDSIDERIVEGIYKLYIETKMYLDYKKDKD